MLLKNDITVLTVSFCEKRKEMKMLDQQLYLSFFYGIVSHMDI